MPDSDTGNVSSSTSSSSTTATLSTEAYTTNAERTRTKAKDTYETVGSKTSVFLTGVRTYVAGILMPTLAVSIIATFGEHPTATITLPADPRLFNVGRFDRVPVMVFVKETVVESPNYIMMFEGFVVSREYMSLASQREINLHCVAFTRVFDDTKLKFMTSIDENAMMSVPGERAINQGIFTPEFAFPLCLFQKGLALKTKDNGGQQKDIECPTEYLANLMQFLEEAGTDHAPVGRYNDSLVSKYYATLAYNLKFDKRFCWLPYFDYEVSKPKENEDGTVSTATLTSAWGTEGIKTGGEECTMFPVLYGLKSSEVHMALQGVTQAKNKEYTVYELLKYLIEQIEYEFLVIANPAYNAASGSDEGTAIDAGRSEVLYITDCQGGGDRNADSPIEKIGDKKEEKIENLQKKYSRERNCDRMVQFCVKPMFDDTFPPKCNIVFRSQVISIQASQQHYGVPTRIQVTNFNPFATMAQLQGTTNNVLGLYGSVDFYPCKYFGDDMSGATENGRAMMSENLDEIEQHTGPFVARNSAPNWVSYAFAKQNAGDEKFVENMKKMREQYMRRQLTRAQILERQLSAECVFLPYITCGFPAVVYDSADSGFSFAGNVIAYEHQLTPVGMTTTITLNGVRLLAEAVAAESAGAYPNPINAIHAVTHNTSALGEVYAAILGTPGGTVSGAEPMTWADVKSTYSGTVTDVTQSPQTNIYEAYKLQRRNVITQEDYCKFMGLTQNPSGTDEEGTTPTELTNAWMADRHKIDVYQAIPLQQVIKPVKDLEKKEAEDLKKKNEELEKENAELEKQNAELTSSTSQKESELQKEADSAAATAKANPDDAEAEKKSKSAASALSTYQNGTKKNNEATIAKNNETIEKNKKTIADNTQAITKLEAAASKKESNQGFSSDASSTELITILKEVRDEESLNNIY